MVEQNVYVPEDASKESKPKRNNKRENIIKRIEKRNLFIR